jgi:putative DNA primase/helicase
MPAPPSSQRGVLRPTRFGIGITETGLANNGWRPSAGADGKLWTMQYIWEDGTKRFAKNSRKEGCFHIIGRIKALVKSPVLVISEGYATGTTLSQILGFATVAAFDSGNLVAVAKALHEKYPEKQIIIAGDDDNHLELTHGINPGRREAGEAARAVRGKVLLPIFAPNKNLSGEFRSRHTAEVRGTNSR